MTSIEEETFSGCSSLASINIPSSVTSIKSCAFQDCSSLSCINFPSALKSIESWAFRNCSSLTSLYIPSTLTHIDNGAFSGCSGLTSIEVDGFNPTYDSRNSCNAIMETATNNLVVGCKNTTIPSIVNNINYEAFSGCTGLTNLTLPSSLRIALDSQVSIFLFP